ncbi:hypothetical protein ACGFW6_19660 [Streptomyces sp. Y7]
MNDGDWSAIARILRATKRWEFLWRLAFAAPPTWGAPIVRMLDRAGWTPADPVESRALRELSALTRASRAVLDCGWVPADATRLSGVEGSVRSLVVPPDGSRACVGTGRGVRLWALRPLDPQA